MSVAFGKLKLEQRGDTIVEVLISIAVISLVLAGAYATTNHSLLASRSAQERETSIKLVEGQLEKVRYAANTDPGTLFAGATATSAFCMSSTGTILSSTNAACSIGSTEPIYHLSILRSGNSFTIKSSWASILHSTGGGTETIQMIYRAYQ